MFIKTFGVGPATAKKWINMGLGSIDEARSHPNILSTSTQIEQLSVGKGFIVEPYHSALLSDQTLSYKLIEIGSQCINTQVYRHFTHYTFSCIILSRQAWHIMKTWLS